MINPIHKSLSNFTFIDLFAGIGGFHLALKSFGAKCIFASEWDKYAANVYQVNFNIQPSGDITGVSEADIPKHDILCGGFPCQAFSVAGKQRGFQDTRGTLFFEIAKIVNHHKPLVLFLENVKNLEKHDSGRTLKVIKETLHQLGYRVHSKVLNSSHFGLPQNRERIYLVAFRKDVDSSEFKFPKETFEPVALQDYLEANPTTAKIINREDLKVYKQFEKENCLFQEFSLSNKPIQIGIVNKGGQGERIYHPLGHAITLSAHGGGVGSKTGLYLVDGVVRKLTPRECARIQGFPETFIIDSNTSQAYKQFGNSVSVNVLQYILIGISKVLEQNCIKHTPLTYYEQSTTARITNS